MACDRIAAAVVPCEGGNKHITAILDPHHPTGGTASVNFNTSKQTLWQTSVRHNHVNWAVCDSDWEAEFCRLVESHPRVSAYAKNHGLGLEVPYRLGSKSRTYIPDFIVLLNDGRGEEDLLHLVVEVKGYRGEDAKTKKQTMDAYWVPAVNRLGDYGRWAFAELKDVYTMRADFETPLAADFEGLVAPLLSKEAVAADWLAKAGGSAPRLNQVPRRRSAARHE